MNIAASIISLLMTLLPFVLRLLLYINCIIPTKARNGCRLAPECVCVCVCVCERERAIITPSDEHSSVCGWDEIKSNICAKPKREREMERWTIKSGHQ